MRLPSPAAPLRVLLLSKTLTHARSGAWKAATAPWGLGAACLRRFVQTMPELSSHVQIEIRTFPSDAVPELILSEVMALAPDVVGFTCQPWNTEDHLRLSVLIKRLLPGIAVWHGGPMVVRRKEYMARVGRQTVDAVVEGEGENAFADLLAHYVFGAPALERIGGIAWFDDDGTLHATEDRANPDVATLPAVMTEENLAAMGSFVLYETARGCPFRCSFCNWGSQKAKLRTRDRAVIEQDLRAILSRPEVTHLWITDAGLDISTEHVLFIAECIRKYRQHPVHVSGYVFLLHQDLEYVAQLVGAFDTLQLGLQTANENVLSEMGRKALSIERFDRILDAVIPHYPGLRVDLLYGLPGIRLRELQDSVRFLLDKGIWLINLYRLVAIPGTEMADHRDKYGIVADEDFPFSVYVSEGCAVGDLFAMQQFKVNMDTLREMFAGESYRRAKAIGLDLVDFASRVHELVPRFNFRTDYGLEMDRQLDADLVVALRDAAGRWARTAEHRRFMDDLLATTYRQASQETGRPEPTRLAARESRQPVPPPAVHETVRAPSAALRGLSPALAAVIGGFQTPLNPERARAAWIEHEAAGPRAEDFGVHIHVPFCKTICTYCDCATEALQDAAQVPPYLDALEREMSYFAGSVTREVGRFYVGGGTPNILSERDLERLLALANAHHVFRADAVRCLEGHPVHSTRAKLDVAAALGVNRVSFGVQSRDAGVLKRVNRGEQTPAHVEQATRDALEAGIREVNLDFIYSLADESADSVFDAVKWGVSLSPTTVCLQLLNDSHFASPYRDEAHRRQVAGEFRVLEARLAEWVAGHAPAYDCDFRPDTVVISRRDMWRDWRGHLEYYSARDATRRSTLGYGRHAQSRLFGRLTYQNQERASRFDPTAPMYAARKLTPEIECLTEIVAELEHARFVSLASLREGYGAGALGALDPLLERMERAGHLERAEGWLRDRALSAEAVAWLARQVLPADELRTPEAPPLGSIRITQRDCAWRVRLEPARPEGRYFAVTRGVGVYYQTDAGTRPDPAQSDRIMKAVVKYADELIGRGVAQGDLAHEIALVLDARLSPAGVRAKSEASQPRRHRLTTVSP